MNRTVTLSFMLAVCGLSLTAQAPRTTAAQEVHANLNQLMRGVLYPAANVVFFAQAEDPGGVKPVPLALAESANLLMVPGRICANGAPVPMKDPDWAAFVQKVRDAGLQAYKAAQAKDQEKMIDISETLSASCAGCHRRWRDRRTPANRCK